MIPPDSFIWQDLWWCTFWWFMAETRGVDVKIFFWNNFEDVDGWWWWCCPWQSPEEVVVTSRWCLSWIKCWKDKDLLVAAEDGIDSDETFSEPQEGQVETLTVVRGGTSDDFTGCWWWCWPRLWWCLFWWMNCWWSWSWWWWHEESDSMAVFKGIIDALVLKMEFGSKTSLLASGDGVRDSGASLSVWVLTLEFGLLSWEDEDVVAKSNGCLTEVLLRRWLLLLLFKENGKIVVVVLEDGAFIVTLLLTPWWIGDERCVRCSRCCCSCCSDKFLRPKDASSSQITFFTEVIPVAPAVVAAVVVFVVDAVVDVLVALWLWAKIPWLLLLLFFPDSKNEDGWGAQETPLMVTEGFLLIGWVESKIKWLRDWSVNMI